MTDIRDRIRNIIAEQAMLDVEQVTDDSSPADLGIDSLGLVESIFALEEEFDITNMGSIIAAVEKLVAAKA